MAQAARREVLEETGFNVSVLRPIDFCFSYPVTSQWRHLYDQAVNEVVENVFVAEVEDGAPRLSPEHSAWRWCKFDEAAKLLKYPTNVEALRRCAAFLMENDAR